MNFKNTKTWFSFLVSFLIFNLFIYIIGAEEIFSYPPAVGILTKSKSCLACHVNNGPWSDNERTIIDIIDKETMKSLIQPDGSFLIEVKRGSQKNLISVFGRVSNDAFPPPYRNAWIFIDPTTIESNSISKFPAGWGINIFLGCRITGDKISSYEGATITVAPFTIQPFDNAADADIQLQLMLTSGESIKGDPKSGMIGNYYEKIVHLKVVD